MKFVLLGSVLVALVLVSTSADAQHFCGTANNQIMNDRARGISSGFNKARAVTAVSVCKSGTVRILTQYANSDFAKGLQFCVRTFIYSNNRIVFALTQKTRLQPRIGMADRKTELVFSAKPLTPRQAAGSLSARREFVQCRGKSAINDITARCKELGCTGTLRGQE